jgi:hypothetical protein
MANLSPALLDKLECDRFIVSSNGESFGHPNPETIARIIATPGRTLGFNYVTGYTRVWDDAKAKKRFRYAVEYPEEENAGYVLEI